MTYELNRLAREIAEKLEAYQSNVQWLEADTQKLAEVTKEQAQYQPPQIEFPEASPRLSPQEIKEKYEVGGEVYLNKIIEDLDKKVTVSNPQYPIDPQRDKMINLFRQNCATDFVISQFIGE